MAEANNVDVLLSVDLNASDTLKALAQLRGETAGLRAEQKALDKSTASGAVEYERLGAQIRANVQTMRGYEKEIAKSSKSDASKSGSIKALRAELSAAKAAYAELSAAERDSAQGQELLKRTADLNAELKALEKTYGDNQRSVGDYEIAGKSLRMELRNMTQQLGQLIAAGQGESKQAQELRARAGELSDAMKDASASINATGSDTRTLDALLGAADLAMAGYTAGLAAFGVEGEAAEESQKKLQQAMAALMAVQRIQNLLQKESNVMLGVARLQMLAAAKAEAIKTAATNAGGKATIFATAQQALFNIVANANPYVLLATALIATVGAFALFARGSREARREQELLNSVVDRTREALAQIESEADFNVALAEAAGASIEELRALRLEAIRTAIAVAEATSDAVSANRNATAEQITDAAEMLDAAYAAEKNYFNSILIEDTAARTEQRKAAEDAYRAAAQEAAASAEQQRKAAQDAALSASEFSQRMATYRLAADKDYNDQSVAYRLAYEAQLFEIEQTGEVERLNMRARFGQLTAEQYDQQSRELAAKAQVFATEQAAELQAFYASEREAIVGMLEQSFDEQIAAAEAKYTDAIERLTAAQISETEEAQAELAATVVRLEDQLAAEVAAIRADALQQTLDTEQAKITEALNRELFAAQGNAREIYEAKRAALEAETLLYADNSAKQLEIQQQQAEAERELSGARLDNLMKWRDSISELYDGLTNLANARSEAELQQVQATYDAESQALADKYAKGKISEAKYNAEVIKLDQKREKEEAKIARQQAIRERAGKVFSITTDTLAAVSKAVAASPITFGLPWSAFAAVTGAANLAAVLAAPLPKAARGGLIVGAPHSAGGVAIEAEGGEAIMTKRAVSAFGPILSALNELGGGVPFAGPLGDGGYMLRSAYGPRAATAAEIADALRDVRIVTAVEDINRGQDAYARIETKGNLW